MIGKRETDFVEIKRGTGNGGDERAERKGEVKDD